MRIRVKGQRELERKLAAARESGPAAVKEALWETGQEILTVSQRDYVPVDTGALKNSGDVQANELGADFVVTVGYGGVAAEYALFVHEDLVSRHVVGQAKYLEIPFRAAVEGIDAVLAQRARDAILSPAQRAKYERLRSPQALRAFLARRGKQ